MVASLSDESAVWQRCRFQYETRANHRPQVPVLNFEPASCTTLIRLAQNTFLRVNLSTKRVVGTKQHRSPSASVDNPNTPVCSTSTVSRNKGSHIARPRDGRYIFLQTAIPNSLPCGPCTGRSTGCERAQDPAYCNKRTSSTRNGYNPYADTQSTTPQ